ncbi:MAG TPA: DUF3352 domain-containing protein [Planctomycetota bacterium]|nr:DUF3352 domain-containing protein [Planctomycetota bacterium]
MKRFRMPVAAVLTLLTVLSAAPRLTWAGDDKPAGWQVTSLLPADTLFVVSVTDAQKTMAKLQKTGLWNIYNNPEVQRAFRAPLMTAQFAVAMAEAQGGFKLNDLVSYFSQGEISFAVLGVDKRTPQGQPLPDLLLSIQARDKTQLLMDEISRRLDQLKAQAGGQIAVTQTPVGNSVVHKITIPLPQGPTSVQYTQCDGNVIFAFGEGRLEKLLANHEKFKAAPPAADAGAAEVLAQNAGFRKVLEKAGPENDLMVYVNVEALRKNPIIDANPKTDKEKRDWQAAGLDGVRAVAYCSGIKDKGVRETFFIDVPAAVRKGLMAMADGEGLTAEALSAAPRTSLLAGAFQIAPDKVLERVIELAALENPKAKEEVNAFFLMLGQQLNIDIKKEMLSALTGQAVFSVSLAARHPKLPVGFPQPLLSLGIKDTVAAKALLSAIRNAAKDNFEFTELASGEHEIITARERFTQGRDPGQFAYVLDKKDVIFSLYPLALREELARRKMMAQGYDAANPANMMLGSLADDKDFKSARSSLMGQPQAMLYLDTGALAVATYDLLIPFVQLRERVPQVDVTALPTSDVLMQNLGGTVFSFSTDADGIMAEGYSPTGAFSLLAAIPAAIQRQRMMGGGRAFGAAGGGGGGGAPQNQKALESGQRLAKDLAAYAAENNGNFPAQLRDMQPKYLQGVTDEELNNVVYRGKQDAPNKVVAHSSEKMRGPITILLQDGRVLQVGRGQLGKVLAEGYKGEAAPATGKQEAVKPPKPPEF